MEKSEKDSLSSREAVKGLIRAAEADLLDIESKILELSRLRQEKRESIASLKELIAPIHTVHAELLVEIFQMASAEAIFWLDPVLVVSQVCAQWRWLVCKTPLLWAGDLELDFERPPCASYLHMAKTFLERSAPLPIPISVKSAPSHTSPLFQYALSLAPRWKSLRFQSSDISGLLPLAGDALENLESVHLTERRYLTASVDVFLGASRLRTVTLDVWGILCFPMPWSQLVHLNIKDPYSLSAQTCLNILLQCKHATLRLRFNSGSEHGRVNSDLVYATIMPFFARLALPALTTLEIHGPTASSGTFWSSRDFTSFQLRCPNIRSLELGGYQIPVSDFASILESSEQLVELRLTFCFSGADLVHSVLKLLQFRSDAPPKVPRLERMYMEPLFVRALDASVLLKTINSRWWSDEQLAAMSAPPPVARWKVFEIVRHGSDQPHRRQFLERLEKLRREGLQVDLK
ncbi:hypothetical protein FB45DRAFT_999566 [Roridomyces roridus]|uniref:F-box domain-containing protein n=1 Tax=Roridomyces roridus TaxID=1738132 RepID=A0AAD7CC06_9AGAR|nr:hypothetical protein FB45DRAFT_999566 [Roridomyces roridus]